MDFTEWVGRAWICFGEAVEYDCYVRSWFVEVACLYRCLCMSGCIVQWTRDFLITTDSVSRFKSRRVCMLIYILIRKAVVGEVERCDENHWKLSALVAYGTRTVFVACSV
jgi:hypothetical protein